MKEELLKQVREEIREFEGTRTFKQVIQDVSEHLINKTGDTLRFSDTVFVIERLAGIVYFLESIEKD